MIKKQETKYEQFLLFNKNNLDLDNQHLVYYLTSFNQLFYRKKFKNANKYDQTLMKFLINKTLLTKLV